MKNALEELVFEVYRQLQTRHPEFCTCERCHDDVIAQALNKARPRYIGGSPIGAAVTRVSLDGDQAKAEIAVLVFDAMRRVQMNPRHGPEEDYVPLGGGGG
jgi:competence protein ComFB